MSNGQQSQYGKGVQGNKKRPSQLNNSPNYANRTQTVIEDQIQKKIPTLILKLQNRAPSGRELRNGFGLLSRAPKLSELSDHELDVYIKSCMQDFKRELMANIDEFQQIVLSAKPNPAEEQQDPQRYRLHVDNYKKFLQLATAIVKRMQDSFNDIFQRYEEHIDHLWTAICQGANVGSLQRHFDDQMHQNMNHYWRPVFDEADKLLREIDLC